MGGVGSGTDTADPADLGGATGADLPGASERTRLGELYGEMPDGGAPEPTSDRTDAAAGTAVLAPPLVRVVRGEPDALELAALIAGLTAASAASETEEEAEALRHRWTDRSHALRGGERGLPAPGPDTWRWSLHP